MKTPVPFLAAVCTVFWALCAQPFANASELDTLKNYRQNGANMVSSGLPSEAEFIALKASGVVRVIDLIPGDRLSESNLVQGLEIAYYNIQVEWQNPTLQNFQEYVEVMQGTAMQDGLTLTHCKLNWRGAVFTYLYQVTQLNLPKGKAQRAMLTVWQPNERWQVFIDEVLAYYVEN